jgi:hypothetical protein
MPDGSELCELLRSCRTRAHSPTLHVIVGYMTCTVARLTINVRYTLALIPYLTFPDRRRYI